MYQSLRFFLALSIFLAFSCDNETRYQVQIQNYSQSVLEVRFWHHSMEEVYTLPAGDAIEIQNETCYKCRTHPYECLDGIGSLEIIPEDGRNLKFNPRELENWNYSELEYSGGLARTCQMVIREGDLE